MHCRTLALVICSLAVRRHDKLWSSGFCWAFGALLHGFLLKPPQKTITEWLAGLQESPWILG